MRAILRFRGPVSADRVEWLTRLGARVLQPVPDDGLVASMPVDADLRGGDVLEWFPIRPEHKLSPVLEGIAEPSARFVAEFHRDVRPETARALALREGLEVRENPDLLGNHLLLVGWRRQLKRLVEWDEVAYVFPASRELLSGMPVTACAGALTELGPVGQHVALIGPGWDGPGLGSAELTYSFGALTRQLPRDQVEEEIRRALAEWAKYVAVQFAPQGNTSARRNVNILFASANHGDGYAFDGPGRIRAHTFYPAPPNPETIAGDLHFDEHETWSVGSRIDLFSIALHELGHALGLGHADEPEAVMYPYYQMVTRLSDIDVAAIRQLYEKARGEDPAAPVQVTIDSPTREGLFRTQHNTASLSGRADHPSGIASVRWTSSSGAAGKASGTNSWSAGPVPLAEGLNRITVTAEARTGEVGSRDLEVEFVRVSSPPQNPNPTPRAPQPRHPDRVSPALNIVSPAGTSVRTADAAIAFRGTASDTGGLSRVTWLSSATGTGTASGTAFWQTGPIPLLVGTNIITIRAHDTSGNYAWRSVTVTRR